MPPVKTEVDCSGCRTVYPTRFIRCPVCERTTKINLDAQERRVSLRLLLLVLLISVVWAVGMALVIWRG